MFGVFLLGRTVTLHTLDRLFMLGVDWREQVRSGEQGDSESGGRGQHKGKGRHQ